MTRRLDVQKRRQWEERFDRFRSGGLTVAKFCSIEQVSVNTFYYWAKRVGLSPAVRSTQPDEVPQRLREPVRPTLLSVVNTELIHFRLGARVEVSVPANCLDVIRCLASCFQDPPSERAGAFHEVMVGTR